MRQPRLHALERRVTRAIGALPLWLQHQMRDSGHVAALLNSLTLAATALIGNIRLLRSRRAARLEIAYGPLPAHRLDIYGEVASRHPTAPAIVFIHGGGWTLGSKLLYGLVGDSLACHGAVCSVVGYRLFPEAAIPEQVDDVRLALQSLHERFPKRPLVLVGHSSGAHVAALTMACAAASGEPLPIRGFCGISGVYDVASHFEHERQRGLHQISPMQPAAGNCAGSYSAMSPMRVISDELSPSNVIRLPVVLLIHGTEDWTVPFSSSVDFAHALHAAGAVGVHCELLEGKGHMDFVGGGIAGHQDIVCEWLQPLQRWLDECVGQKTPQLGWPRKQSMPEFEHTALGLGEQQASPAARL